MSRIESSDCKCCVCGRQAVAFWPVFDIDQEIPPRPYCRRCLDKAKKEMLISILKTEI